MPVPDFDIRSTALWPDDDLDVRSVGDGLTFEGYALKFNSWSLPIPGGPRGAFREQFAPGSFARTLERGPDIVLQVQHSLVSLPLGRTTAGTFTVRTDDVGLITSGELPDNELGRPVRDAIRRGDVRNMSIRFRVPNAKTGERWNADYSERTVVEAALGPEISIVTFPAYPDTTAAVRALAYAADLPEDELGDAIRRLLDADVETKLTPAERDLIVAALNSKSESKYIPATLAQKYARLRATA